MRLRKPRAQRFEARFEAEIDAELRFHLEQLTRENIARGLSPEEARRAAILEFGAAERIKEELRDVHRIPFFDAAATHLRHAFRSLWATPSFSLTVILTLTLGIGANTAVFSAIDAVLLRPLPYPDSGRLMVIHEYRAKDKNPERPVAPARIEDWNRMNAAFESLTGYYTEDVTFSDASSLPVKITRAFVAPRFLQVLGITPALGHDFTGASSNEVLVSDRFWREHLAANPNAIGQPVRPGSSSTVVGVMPAGFAFPSGAASDAVQLWYPVRPSDPYAQDRRNTWYTGLGRLRPSFTPAQARANLDLVQRDLARQFPATDTGLSVEVQQLKETTIGNSGRSLWLLFGAVSLLMLIACANVSALVLSRNSEREREFSVRASLGASRLNLMAQVLTETLLLAVFGTLTGLAIAGASARILTAMARNIPRIGEIGLDWRLFLYTAACAVFATLISGLLPAFRAGSAAPAGALSQGGRTQVSRRRPAQWILVSVQVALAVCLLSGAGLMLRSFVALSRVSPGFDADHVLAFRLTGSYGETADMPGLRQSIRRTLDALRALPGVEGAASVNSLPGVPTGFPLEWTSPDSAFDPSQKLTAETRTVSEGYFATMNIPILAGAACDAHSEGTGVVVNRSFASAYYGSGNTIRGPIGHHLAASFPGAASNRILGVAADARESGVNHEPVPTVYWCDLPINPTRAWLVRTSSDPSAFASAIRNKVHQVEPARAVYDLAPLPSQWSEAFGEDRLRTLLLTLFAVTALSLACVGIYGSLSYFVSIKRREIGLRIALGARRNQIGMRFVLRGLSVALTGVAAGLCLAAWSTRFVEGMLYQVHPNDAATFFAATAAMMFVALLASSIPALRAASVDPMRVLGEN